jgi:hypothetical protein
LQGISPDAIANPEMQLPARIFKRHLLPRAGQRYQDGFRMRDQALPLAAQADVVAAAHKEGDAQCLLELLDPGAHGRLRNEQVLGGAAEMAGLAHLQKSPQQFRIHLRLHSAR